MTGTAGTSRGRTGGGVVPGRVELPTSTLSVWRSNQLSYRTGTGSNSSWPLSFSLHRKPCCAGNYPTPTDMRTIIIKTDGGNNATGQCGTPPKRQLSRKEVFQPHLPVRLPCYDLAPITGLTLGRPSRSRLSGTPGFHGLTGGVYKARERIHRAMADARLLANPASWSRVADSSPNWEGISGFAWRRRRAARCTPHCNTCVAPDVRAVLI